MALILLFCFLGFIGGISLMYLIESIVKSCINNDRNRTIQGNSRLNRFFDLFTRS